MDAKECPVCLHGKEAELNGVCKDCSSLVNTLEKMSSTSSVKEGWLDTIGQYLLLAQKNRNLVNVMTHPCFSLNHCGFHRVGKAYYLRFPGDWDATHAPSYQVMGTPRGFSDVLMLRTD